MNGGQSISAELRALMDQRRACWPQGIYPMPGDPRLDKAAKLDAQIIEKAAAEGFREVDAWRAYEDKSVVCVQYEDGSCYVQHVNGAFLGDDGRWTKDQGEAWTTTDRAHAETVARQQNAKVRS